MKSFIVIIGLVLIANASFAQDKEAYRIYTAQGKKSSYKKMLSSLEKDDVVLFGEQHNSAIAHWLQLELTRDLDDSRDLILGAEMFERDNQLDLESYLAGNIDEKTMDTLVRLWPNYKTDYRPLVEYAKEKNIKFIGTNIPRRYASLVYKKDFQALDTLSDEEKSWMAPLPIVFDPELPTYKEILEMMGEHGSPKLVKAQAIKDATMAYFISQNYKEGSLFIHYNGAFHSNKYEGILWYLKLDQPDLNYATISTVIQSDVRKLDEENKKLADFIIVVDEDVTTTY